MLKRILTPALAVTLLACALYAPPVEAAGIDTLPAAFARYIDNAFTAVSTFFDGLFGGGTSRSAEPAAAVVPLSAAPMEVAAMGATTTAPAAPRTTIIEKTVYVPATASPSITVTGVSRAEFDQKLAALQTSLEQQIAGIAGHADSFSSGLSQSFALTNAGAGNSTGATLHDVTVDGVHGLTASDIPDISTSYLSTASGGIVSGYLTVAGNTTLANATTTSLFVKQALSASTASFGGTATSSFSTAGALTLASALTVGSGGTGTTTWQTGSIPFFDGSKFTENNPLFRWDATNNGLLSLASSTIGDGVTGLTISGDATTTGTAYVVGLGTWGTGFLAQASSTVVGNFTTTGTNTLTGALTVAGDTTLANATTSSLFVKSALASNSASFGGTATSTFGTNGALTLASALTVGNGGTGATSFGQGWVYSSGGTGALAASTSPTVNYLTATSTTATSTFSGGLTAGGSGGLTVLQNGSVGIGTTSPATTLSVAGSGYLTGGLGIGVVNTSAGSLQITGGATIGGSVLVTSNASGSFPSFDPSVSHTSFALTDNIAAGSAEVDLVNTSSIAGGFRFYQMTGSNAGTALMTIGGNGNVGIGTTTPGYNLTVSSPGTNQIAISSSDAGSRVWSLQSTSGTSPQLAGTFQIIDRTANAARLLIDSAGNVGIGTTTPQSLLSVASGSAGSWGTFPSGTWEAQVINNTDASGQNGLLVMNRWAGSDSTAFQVGGLYSGTSQSFFMVNGIGNVGIGTTTPTEKLSILSADNTSGTNIFAVRANNLTQGIALGYNTIRTVGTNPNVDLNLVTQGTGNLLLLSGGTGNVGVGATSTPWKTLSVSGDLALTGGLFDSTASAGSNGAILQSTGSATKWVATSTLGLGNGTFLGLSDTIGSYTATRIPYETSSSLTDNSGFTFNPTLSTLTSTLLHAAGSTTPTLAAGQGAYIGWNALAGTTGETDFINQEGAGSGGFAWYNATSTNYKGNVLAALSGAGNLGIGTTSPTQLLEVGGGTGAARIRINGGNTNSGDGAALWFANNSGNNSEIGNYSAIVGGAYNEDLAIWQASGSNNILFGTANTERMRITNGGNVGIGTTSPSHPFTLSSGVGTFPQMELYQTITNATAGLQMDGNNGAAEWDVAADFNGFDNAFDIVHNNSTRDFTITTSGNVGIGTTSPTTLLELGSSAGSPDRFLQFSSANDPKGFDIGISAGSAGGFIFTKDAAPIYFGTNNSTQQVTIANGGNVGIGTTTPTEKLSILSADNTSGTNIFAVRANNLTQGIALGYNTIRTVGTNPNVDLNLVTQGTGNLLLLSGGTGNVGVGATSTPWKTLSVSGTVALAGLTTDTADAKTLCLTANNEVVANAGSSCITSSQRFKTDIEPLATSSGLTEVLALSPVSFAYKPEIGIPGTQVGFIAEAVQAIDPRLVVLDASGTPFTVRYENLTAILAKAIQEVAAVSGAFRDNLIVWLGDSANGINDFFAKHIYGDTIYSREDYTQKLCVGDSPTDPSPVCVTKAQLTALLHAAGLPNSPASVTSTATTATDTPSCTLAATPSQVAPGDHAVLSWTTTDPGTFSIDQGIGAVSPAVSGTTTSKAITADTTFTGTATSPTGQVATCTAAVSVKAATSDTPPATDTAATSTTTPSGAAATTTAVAPTTSTSTQTTAVSTSSPASADTAPPVITLNGAAVNIAEGSTWSDPGATATDSVDGDLTAKIVASGTVDTATPGLYTLTYSVTDAAGNTGSASRVVTVTAAAPSVPANDPATAATTGTGSASSTPS